jgi:hypothetical protein
MLVVRIGVGNGHRERFRIGLWARLLMWRPRAANRLRRRLQVVDHLWKRPDRRTLTGLRQVHYQIVQSWVALAIAGRFVAHSFPSWRSSVTASPCGPEQLQQGYYTIRSASHAEHTPPASSARQDALEAIVNLTQLRYQSTRWAQSSDSSSEFPFQHAVIGHRRRSPRRPHVSEPTRVSIAGCAESTRGNG